MVPMKQRRLRPTVAVFCVCMLLQLMVPATAAGGIEFLRISEQMVSLQIDQTDIRQVLEEFAVQGEIKLWISDNFPGQQVSARFKNQTIEAALRRLLRDINYALVFAGNGVTITGIYILPPGNAPSVAVDINPGQYGADQSLRQALESTVIPDNIKSGLLYQAKTNNEARTRRIESQGIGALSRLIEKIEQNGTANPEIIHILRASLGQAGENQ